MPSQEEFEELKGRIVELENQLKAKGAVAAAPETELTPRGDQGVRESSRPIGRRLGRELRNQRVFSPTRAALYLQMRADLYRLSSGVRRVHMRAMHHERRGNRRIKPVRGPGWLVSRRATKSPNAV